MITPGILTDLHIVKAEKNDKGTLVITIQQGQGDTESLDAIGKVTSQSESEQQFYFWPLKADDRLTTAEAIGSAFFERFKDFRNQLGHVLEQFMAVDNLKFSPTAGMPHITTITELKAALGDPDTGEAVAAKLYDNYINDFIGFITPVLQNGNTPALRGKFVRASKDKHFASLPRFIPFFEHASIPEKSSRLSFSAYELGFRTGDDKKDKTTWTSYDQSNPMPGGDASAEDAAAVDKLFPATNR